MNKLMWFRSDLRAQDNMALHYATHSLEKNQHCIGLFIISHAQWDKHDMGSIKRAFTLQHVQALQQSLKAMGIPLIVLEVPLYKDIPDSLSALCAKYKIDELYANYEYPINEIERDQHVVDALKPAGIDTHFYHDFVVHKPGSIRTQNGDYYKVFTQFKKNWLKQTDEQTLREYTAKSQTWPSDIELPPYIFTPEASDADKLKQWPIEGLPERMQQFIDERGHQYKAQRDFPAVDGTSSLSAYLAIGAMSIRACLRYTQFNNEGRLGEGDEGIVTWVSELIWRDFYQHILIGFPLVCKHQPFQAYTRAVQWRSHADDLQAWKEGRTGIPIVDAAMRQLNQTGWMHNRLRMVVAMFLTKNLLIDWREGEKYFAQKLIDWEFGANNGGWQWAASTGTDAAPYFRIFNPVSQSQRFDADGDFIRRFVPELTHLDKKQIHEPYAASGKGLFDADLVYPHPIVDLKMSRQRAIDAFKQAKKISENA